MLTNKQLRDIHEECQLQESCFHCPYHEDSNCNLLWDYTKCIPDHLTYEELVQIAFKRGIIR